MSTPPQPRPSTHADPEAYLGTFSSNDAGWFTGMAQQAGASWWGVDGDAWNVKIAEEPTEKVAGYWGGLVEEGVIDNKPMYTPEWNTALNTGKQVGWLSAAWAPGVSRGQRRSHSRHVESGTHAAVGCLQAVHRQLGRLFHRRHVPVQEPRRRRQVRHVAEHRP